MPAPLLVEVYKVPEGAEVAVIWIKDNIYPASTMEAKNGRKPIDWIFKAIDSFNTVLAGESAIISGVDGVATAGH